MEEFYIDSDGIRLHAKLDKAPGVDKGPLCILIHGFTYGRRPYNSYTEGY